MLKSESEGFNDDENTNITKVLRMNERLRREIRLIRDENS